MPGVAINGSEIYESVKSGHVTYSIEHYEKVGEHCAERDTDTGSCIDWDDDYDWVSAGSGSTGARITGFISLSNSKIKISGVGVATVGDRTIERWEASPSIPSSDSSYRYTATSPTSGTGQGTITLGSTKGKLGGKSIALIGSTVTTCLGTTTTIKTGNEKMKFGS
ncbi:hypothetical protein D3C74_277760 [compost metagenome]